VIIPPQLGGILSVEQSLEFLSNIASPSGGLRKRRWSEAEKAHIVAQTLEIGAKVGTVARHYGVKANHLSSWRTLAKEGKLVLPAMQDGMAFAPVVVAPKSGAVADAPHAGDGSFIDILVGPVTIRLGGNTPASRIAELASALKFT
jgi:transposase